MSYWRYDAAISEEEVTEYENNFGQKIRLGDEVCWPTWTAGISKGKVYRITKRVYERTGRRWDPVTKTLTPDGTYHEIKHRLRVEKEYSKPVIYYAGRVFKMEKP